MLIWNISNSTWRQLIVLWKVQNHNVRSSGHNARSALFDRGTGTIDLRQLLFWHRKFSCDPTNYERCLHPSDTLAYRGVHNNSFLTLRVIHELKKEDRASFVGLLQGLYSRYNKITLNGKKKSLQRLNLVKKKFLQIVMLKKNIHTQKKLPSPPPPPPPQKLNGPSLNQFRNKSSNTI